MQEQKRTRTIDALCISGVVLVAVGVGMLSLPWALIVVGVLLCVGACIGALR